MNTIKINSKNVKMIAHRGLSGIERENTYPAFVAAGNRTYFGIETDVHITVDGKFVIMHDETTKKVSLGKVDINIEENTFDELKDIVLPDLDESEHRQDIRIPLLIDYIKICKKYDKICVLELKNSFDANDLNDLVMEIKSLNYLENVIFISFVLDNCILLRYILPDAKIQWLYQKEITEEVISTLVQYKFDLDVYYMNLTKEHVDKLHSKGIKVNCWTCNEKEDAEKLVEMGVDFITTNILE